MDDNDCLLESILLESMKLAPVNVLKERHPVKFQLQTEFKNTFIKIAQNPGCATGLKNSNGGTVWNCAKALTKLIENMDLTGMKVLELGSGTGICGIAASMAGANVTITDKKSMKDLLETNVSLNETPNTVEVSSLSWGRSSEHYDQKWDLIIGSDIVYGEETFNGLMHTISRLCGFSISDENMDELFLQEKNGVMTMDYFLNFISRDSFTREIGKSTRFILSFKLRQEYPCLSFFLVAKHWFHMRRIKRSVFDPECLYENVFIIEFIPKI